MNVLEPFAVAARALGVALGQIIRIRIWLPYLVILVVHAAVLLVIVSFHNSTLLPVALPLVQLLGGEGATHYPTFYQALPTMLSRSDTVITVLLTSIATGITTLMFARVFGVERAENPWRRGFARAPILIVLSLLLVAIFIAISALRSLIPAEVMLNNGTVRWGVRGAGLAVFIVIQSLFVYTTAWVMLAGNGIGSAILNSFRVTSRTLLPTLLVVGIPSVLLFPLSYAASRTDFIVDRFKPEMVTVLVSTQMVAELLATFVVVGAVTRLFIWRMRRAQ